MSGSTLKPCPFCGEPSPQMHDDRMSEVAFVFCVNCGAAGPSFDSKIIDYEDAECLAATQWNDRTGATP